MAHPFNFFDIQLKGSGRTPFSRGGDGRATLSSMLREYLISESMHHLNNPTTRSLAVIDTGEKVNRETGSNLKAPVTGKVKRGSKAAKRRKSFCARMKGVKGATSKGGKLTRKGLALKKWKCN